MTPREAFLLLDSYIENKEVEEKSKLIDMMSLAWHTANFSNAKKLPNLNKLIKDITKDNKKQSNKNKNKMSEDEIEKHYQKKVVNK